MRSDRAEVDGSSALFVEMYIGHHGEEGPRPGICITRAYSGIILIRNT
jgi:hypothetical protein